MLLAAWPCTPVLAQGPTAAAADPDAAADRRDRQLELELDLPACADAVRAAEALLLAHHVEGIGPVEPASDGADERFAPRTATGPLLAWLWLGRDALAREILRSEVAMASCRGGVATSVTVQDLREPRPVATGATAGRAAVQVEDDEAASWLLLHHYWYLRATADIATIRAHWPVLEAVAEHLAEADGATSPSAKTLPQAVLTLHALACCGGLRDTVDRIEHPAAWRGGAPAAPPGTVWARRAFARLQELERHHWCAATQAFTVQPLALIPAASAVADDLEAGANLLPCWIGMLTTTGDKTTQNARTTLHRLGHGDGRIAATTTVPDAAPLAQAMAVVALAQFGGDVDAAIEVLLGMLPPRAPTAPFDPLAIGAAVDALLFALTGVRMATGPGIDEDWLRLRPRLPPGAERLRVRGLRHDGWSAELNLARRTGTPTDAERDVLRRCGIEAAAGDGSARLHGSVVIASADPPRGYHRVVVDCGGRQLVAPLRQDERLEFAAFAAVALVSATTASAARGPADGAAVSAPSWAAASDR